MMLRDHCFGVLMLHLLLEPLKCRCGINTSKGSRCFLLLDTLMSIAAQNRQFYYDTRALVIFVSKAPLDLTNEPGCAIL